MPTDAHLQDITRTIQLAVAPVFVLNAIAAVLGVLSLRLSRIVDRARFVEAQVLTHVEAAHRAWVLELRLLSRRARFIHAALTCGTIAALLVCLLIAVAFVGYLYQADVAATMAVLFVLAMAALVSALVLFLREVFIAVATLQFSLPPDAR
jgi:hypothetical protein